MAGVDTLVELNGGSPVSNSSPQSPDGDPLLGTPLTLDFDPLSFEFKEPAALSPKDDAIPEMESPDQTDDSSSQMKSNRDGSDLDIFDPLSSSSDPRELHISSSVSSFELLTQVEQKAEYEMQMRKNDTVLSDIESKEESEQVSIDSLHNGPNAPDSLIDSSTHEMSAPESPEPAVAASPIPNEIPESTTTTTTTKPDIVNDILLTEPENDQQTSDVPCDLVCDDNIVLENNIEVEQVTNTEQVATDAVHTDEQVLETEQVTEVLHLEQQVTEITEVAESTTTTSTTTTTSSTTVECVTENIADEEEVLETNVMTYVEDTAVHDSAPDEVFDKHEDYLTDSDADHSGAASSGGSSTGMNKKESSKKKKTTKRKPLSSTSSDSGKEDSQIKESKTSKSTTSTKTIHVEKKVTEKKTTLEKEVKIENAESTAVTMKKSTTTVSQTCNGTVNGVDHGKYSVSSDDEEKEYLEDTEDGSVSVARLRSTYSSLSDHQDEVTSPFKEYDAITGVSLEDLKMQYENSTAHKELTPSPTKEIINTGIDIKSLKSSYTQNATVERTDVSPTREVFSTGVDIQTLKSTFNGHHEVHKSKDTEVIETGISVKSLKSSFSSSQESVEATKNQEQEGIKPSVDRAKVTRKFNQDAYPLYAMLDENDSIPKDEVCACKICGNHVYHMEKIKAEKSVFHKNCFRCKECGKALTVDSYDSHEGEIYCKPHFKTLFQPKARFDGDDPAPTSKPVSDESEGEEGKQKKNEVIIRENIPEELPPDVVRSDSKADDGLDFVPNLSNIRLRFESPQDENPHLPSIADRSALQRSESIMQRMMKYQSAVSGERTENGDVSSSASEDEGERDRDVVRETKQKEKVPFSGLSSLKSQWESGAVSGAVKDEHDGEKKEIMNKLRQRICLGRSESMRAVYEKAIQESSTAKPIRSESVVLDKEINAGSIKEKFEKGEVITEEVQEKLEKARKEKEDDLSVFDPSITSEARSLFKQMEANHQAATPLLSPCKSPVCSQKNKPVHSFPPTTNGTDVVKCSEPSTKEEIVVETVAVQEKFKFFENFKDSPKEKKRFEMTPPREPGKVEVSNEPEPPRDPNIVRACDTVEDIVITDTAKRMLDKFKALEKEVEHPPMPSGPKPLKRITPPREYTATGDHENSPEPERDPDIVRASYKTEEEIVVEADKARSLKAKFENWQDEVVRENKNNEEEDYLPQADIAKNLRAKFEAIREETLKPVEKPKPKVHRFINETNGTNGEVCSICNKRLYPMEKMETSGFRLHKNCFRCAYCSSLLRLENYTTSGGKLYCTPHFKQLFITKGNYDEGFGREQHKEKWNRSCSSTPTSHDMKDEDMNGCANGDAHHTENGYQEVVA